jgi:hypothetical protein
VVDPAAPIVCVIGPEGGIAAAELDAFLAVGARPYCLGPTVLRTSTAGAIAVAQLRLLADLAARPAADPGHALEHGNGKNNVTQEPSPVTGRLA